MARRSVHNPRYQKDAKTGKTRRRSAASAKPKRSVGERTTPPEKTPEKKSRPGLITTPEIKRQRKRWWIFMGIALASAALLLLDPVQENGMLQSAAIAAWATSFIFAVYIDWFVIRKLRKAEMERLKKEEKKGK